MLVGGMLPVGLPPPHRVTTSSCFCSGGVSIANVTTKRSGIDVVARHRNAASGSSTPYRVAASSRFPFKGAMLLRRV